jgi:predicted RNase H-like HicB family nuclease
MTVHVTVRRRADGGFVAECTELPGCVTRGHTEREARRRFHQAVRGYVASVTDFVPRRLNELAAPPAPAERGARGS